MEEFLLSVIEYRRSNPDIIDFVRDTWFYAGIASFPLLYLVDSIRNREHPGWLDKEIGKRIKQALIQTFCGWVVFVLCFIGLIFNLIVYGFSENKRG